MSEINRNEAKFFGGECVNLCGNTCVALNVVVGLVGLSLLTAAAFGVSRHSAAVANASNLALPMKTQRLLLAGMITSFAGWGGIALCNCCQNIGGVATFSALDEARLINQRS